MLAIAVAYFRYAKDTPVRKSRRDPRDRLSAVARRRAESWSTFIAAARDLRVWLLFITYGACFGVELTIHNLAAVYYVDRFGLSVTTAGLYVGCFGLLALFARSLGGLDF